MSAREWQARVEAIVEAIRNLREYTANMTFEEFANDTKTIRAAAYEVGIIGEAATEDSF